MYIAIGLQPDLLRDSFSEVRSVLVGKNFIKNVKISSKTTSKKLAFLKSVVWKKVLQTILTLMIIFSVTTVAILTIPDLYYYFSPADTSVMTPTEKSSPLGGDFALGTETATPTPVAIPESSLPPQDMSLPAGRWLIIPRIGVRTELQETEDVEAALAKGVWMAPDFGQPAENEMPIIAAAHRYGWQWWWQSDYWKYHSFYLLPDTEPGDLIEIIDDHRKYTYEIYAGEEGEEITDYEANLILYTCKFLNSPIRHFRYARLVDWEKNTQAS